MSTDPLQEKYPNISTYAYTAQNPIKYIDPDGKDIWDFLYGLRDAVVDNFTLGAESALGGGSQSKVSNPAHYNSGRASGDIISVIGGGAEVAGGSTLATGGALITPTGVGTAPGIGAIVGGVATATHGAGIIGKALQGNGRMEEASSNTSSSSNSSSPSNNSSKSNKDFKRMTDKEVKDSGIDAHDLKKDFLGDGKNSNFDLFKDTNTGEVLIMDKKAKSDPIRTGEFIEK